MRFQRLVQIISDSRSIWLEKKVSLSVNERGIDAAQGALDDGLDVAAEAPQTRWEVAGKQKRDVAISVCPPCTTPNVQSATLTVLPVRVCS